MFQIVCETDVGATFCRLSGDFDAAGAPEFREVTATLMGAPAVVFDLDGVPFMDSAGLGALIAAVRRLRDNGGQSVVCCKRPAVLRLLRSTGLGRVVPIAVTRREALGLLPPPALAV